MEVPFLTCGNIHWIHFVSELSLSAVEQFSGKGQSKGSTPKGKSWKQKKSTPKSAKQSKLHNNSNTSAIVITDDEDLDIMETSKPIVYIDRADLPSPDFGNVRNLIDNKYITCFRCERNTNNYLLTMI